MFLRLLSFLNLTDRHQKLSITNLAVIVVITKIAIAPQIDWTVAASLLIALLSYRHKSYQNDKADQQTRLANPQLDAVTQRLTTTEKAIENVAEQVSKLSLANVFGKRVQ